MGPKRKRVELPPKAQEMEVDNEKGPSTSDIEPSKTGPSTPKNGPSTSISKPLEDVEDNKKFRKLVSEKIKDSLTCPVCHEFPRSSPVFSCINGHLMCKSCHPKLTCCPICNSESINCRNIFAEQLGVDLLDEIQINCPNQGCTFEDVAKNMKNHLVFCQYRAVSCPRFGSKNCKWRGPLLELLSHIEESKCVTVLEETSCSRFCTYEDEEEDLFERNGPLFWASSLFVTDDFFAYTDVRRTSEGRWYFVVRSLRHESTLDQIQVNCKVESIKPNGIHFEYNGPPVSCNLTEKQVLDSGCCLELKDNIVKLMMEPDKENKLFKYTMKLSKLDNKKPEDKK